MQKKQDCELVSGLLADYAEDLLDGDEKRLVEEHVAGCAECSRELDGFRRMTALLKAAAYVPPPGMTENVAKRIRRYNRISAVKRGILRYGGIAAAAAVVLGAALRFAPLLGKGVSTEAIMDSAQRGSASLTAAAAADGAPAGETVEEIAAEAAGADAGGAENENAADHPADEDISVSEYNPAAEYDSAGEAPMMASLFAAPAAASTATPEAEAYGEEAAGADAAAEEPAPMPAPSSARTFSSAVAPTGSAEAGSEAAPLKLCEGGEADSLLRQYAADYIGKAAAVYLAVRDIDGDEALLGGFEKIAADGCTLYVSDLASSAENAAANASVPGGGSYAYADSDGYVIIVEPDTVR